MGSGFSDSGYPALDLLVVLCIMQSAHPMHEICIDALGGPILVLIAGVVLTSKKTPEQKLGYPWDSCRTCFRAPVGTPLYSTP